MASKTTLNAKNLEALGAEQLAQLLMEISTGNTAAKRKLRFALQAEHSPKALVREIDKNISRIGNAQTTVSWKKRTPLINDLRTLGRSIVEQIAPVDAEEAQRLLWRFWVLEIPVIERTSFYSEEISQIFREAAGNLGDLAKATKVTPKALAEMVFDGFGNRRWYECGGLVKIMSSALGEEGLEHLKSKVEEFGQAPAPKPWGMPGRSGYYDDDEDIRYDDIPEQGRKKYDTNYRFVWTILKEIADARGDVDGYIALHEEDLLKRYDIASGIADRLIAADRVEDALGYLDRVEIAPSPESAMDWERILLRQIGIPRVWQNTRILALERLGRQEEAQAFRWTCFEEYLQTEHLRDYLKRLPDFEDIETENRAMDWVAAHPSFTAALLFFVDWPAHDRAAKLLTSRYGEIDGRMFSCLVTAAEHLSERYPLEATLVLRAIVDYMLSNRMSVHYKTAAACLDNCKQLASSIRDFGEFEEHDDYFASLRDRYHRLYSFWYEMERWERN